MKKWYVLLLLVISVVEFLPIALAPAQPNLKGDSLGHLFKIQILMDKGWESWIEEWYTGFPFLRFYPPMSYLIASFLGKILGNAVQGYAITLMLSSFLGALSLHIYLKRLEKEPYVAPIIFLIFPWHLGVAYIEGNFPRATAINLSPLFILGVLLLTEYRERYLLVSALAISLVILTHHSIILPLLVLSAVLHWRDFKELRIIGNVLRVTGAVVFLTAFWYVPFFYDKNLANFTRISENSWLFEYYSLKPSLLLKPEFMVPILAISFLVGLSIKFKSNDISKIALFGLSIYLSLGAYSPTSWLYSLPIMSLIPPYRWLDLTNILVPLIVADTMSNLSKKWRTIIGLATVLLITIPFFGSIPSIEPIPKDTLELADYLSNQSEKGERFLVNSPGAVYSYLPILSGKNTLNGWYHEGNPTDKEMARLWYLLSNNKNASFYLKAYNVKYLINSEQYGYTKINTIGRYTIYTANVSFVQPVSTVMVGKFYDLPLDYAYVRTPSFKLHAIKTVIYVGDPDNETEERLEEFVKKGGKIIWIPETSGELFGIRASMKIINSSSLESTIYNISKFAPFKYEDFPWYGPVFQNVTPLVTMDNWTLIGVKQIGNGTLYLLGGNFLYHILYTESDYELEILKNLLTSKNNIQIKALSLNEGEYSFEVTTNESMLIMISEAYYPYWKITVNGNEVKALRDDRTGLTLLEVNGSSKINAVFIDPFEKLRKYSAFAWGILIIYTFIKFKSLILSLS